jgi:hypothetical protein
MNIFNKSLIAAAIAMPLVLPASIIEDKNTVETAGIFIRELVICHQHEWRNLTINLEYNADVHGSATNVENVKDHIRMFLKNYSNPDEFWEIMNTKLVGYLSEIFPDMTVIKSTLSLAPDKSLDFPRESIVEYDRESDVFQESFNFTKLNYLICQTTFQSLNLHVSWEMKDNPGATDYPDYQWVDEAIELFFKERPLSFSEWKSLKPELHEYLLERFHALANININICIVD